MATKKATKRVAKKAIYTIKKMTRAQRAAFPAKGTVKATIVKMLVRKNGVNETEVKKALGWKRARTTIGRTIAAAVQTGRYKERPRARVEGGMRYYLVAKK